MFQLQQVWPHSKGMLEEEEKETRKCFKCGREGHIAKDYKGKQSMKKQKIQEELDDDEDNKEEKKKQCFEKDFE